MEEALRHQTVSRMQKRQQLAVDESTGDSTGGGHSTEQRNTSTATNVGESSSSSSASSATPAAATIVRDIELVFKQYPGQGGNSADNRYIKTTVNATGYCLSINYFNDEVHVPGVLTK